MAYGRLGIRRLKPGIYEIIMGIPGWRRGMRGMRYGGLVVAQRVQNINMDRGELRRTLLPGLYTFKGWVARYGWDSFVAIRPLVLKFSADVPFDVEVDHRIVARNRRSYVHVFPPV